MALNKKDQEKVQTLLTALGISSEMITFSEEDDLIKIAVEVQEDEAGIYIGRFASVLDSLQLLISIMLNQGDDRRHILLDIGGYRGKRLNTLSDMANRLAAEATSAHAPRAFPPLSATERRQIHLMFADHATLTTFSQGDGYDRRLFIAPKE